MVKYPRYLVTVFLKGAPTTLGKCIIDDARVKKFPAYENSRHITGAVEWILRAQQANNDGGVAALYSLIDGWHSSYPETTGYIIPTMFNYYAQIKDEKMKNAIQSSAVAMADWELTQQFPSGAFPGAMSAGKKQPIVFNTGQILFGMVRAYTETKQKKYLDATIQASDWLVSVQHPEGYWLQSTYLNTIHTYKTRVTWALLQAYFLTKKSAYRKAAEKNLEWALKQQLSSGWFLHTGFYDGQEPLLHTIAYAIQGFLECGLILKNKKYITAAQIASDNLLAAQRSDGSLAGSFDKNWKSSVSWSCLTADAQMAIVWLRLYGYTHDKKYLIAAKRMNHFLKTTQNLTAKNSGVRGGIKGAQPIYGWYAPLCYINWAAKFFIDALILEDDARIGEMLG